MAYKTTPLKRKGCGPQSLGSPLKKKGPCWEGYEMVGMKKKGGRQVPNCVPKKGGKPSPMKNYNDFGSYKVGKGGKR
tara:strand:+ start:210 stop:440 length:231 start_codon:yes stop_codon:yes gene_type:complete